jgi:3-deoxy-7-phosphoheptulonate synthase
MRGIMMKYNSKKKLPTIEEIVQYNPLTSKEQKEIIQHRHEIQDILAGKDDRYIVIVGPCSAWPKEAVLEYAKRLVHLNKKLKHALKIVMRVYVQKPRTIKGWLGPYIQPDPFSISDVKEGMKYTRDIMIKIIKTGMPIASEVLFTHNAKTFLDLLSWAAIGARSTEDQEHRIFASAIDCPVGLKNPTHGSLEVGVNSVVAAQFSHMAVLDGYEVQTFGNKYAHMVLRGSNKTLNYSCMHLIEVKRYMDIHKVSNPAVLIDASHDNCIINGKKEYHLQPNIVMEVIEELKKHPHLRKLVKGFMIESFLKAGNQKLEEQNPSDIDLGGLSLTDPCIGWEKTEDFLLKLAETVCEDMTNCVRIDQLKI